MKIITLWEPWATLLALGQKRIETRGWSTAYRGLVAIHAAKGGLSKREFVATVSRPIFRRALGAPCCPGCFRGCIVGVGRLVDCCPSESKICLPGVFDEHPKLDTAQEREFGNYTPGRFGLVFEDPKLFRTPIPYSSRQGKLLDLTPELELLLTEAYAR
ncbi:MAG TPA: ASCH domain-containing protein [Bryobacteraceae bacterium]|nr:ASCH domain-containing protein [Bryobacteraceae bacterium]